MKKIYFIINIYLLMLFTVSAQNSTTLSPVKDSWTCDAVPTSNYGTATELVVADWTSGGEYKCRTFIEFDLSSIPAGATITSAYLKLYTANPSVYAPSGNSGDNKTYIQRITSSWTESGITWINSPSVTSTNQVGVGATTSADHIFNINVTDMVADMYTNPSQNFGFCMKLQDESIYKNFALISKENSNTAQAPTLIVNYVLGGAAQTFSTLKDAWVCDVVPTNNYGTATELVVADWTSGGEYKCRTFLEFDLSSIPTNAVVQNAMLTLYTMTPSVYAPSGNSGDNKTYIQSVSSAWDENAINWNNQPSGNTSSQVSVEATTGDNYVFNIDVTSLAQSMITNPSQNYGFLMKLQDESIYKNFALGSKENADNTKHPKLTINYAINTGITQLSMDNNKLLVSPNPSSSIFNIAFDKPFIGSIVDLNGRVICNFASDNSSYILNVSEFSRGLYFIILNTADGIYSKKVIVE